MPVPTDTAYRESVSSTISDVAGAMQQLLGQRLVAYAVGVRSPKLVGRWAAPTVTPNADAQRRLRELYRVYRLLALEFSDETAAAWLSGMNPDLDDRVPLDLLHEDRAAVVLRAAAAFVEPTDSAAAPVQ